MSRIVFLLEERSMKVLMDGLLPRMFPELDFLCVPHEGKQDLENNSLRTINRRARYRNPDSITNPSNEIVKLIPEFQKISGARRMAPYLSEDGNNSPSF